MMSSVCQFSKHCSTGMNCSIGPIPETIQRLCSEGVEWSNVLYLSGVEWSGVKYGRAEYRHLL